MPHIEAADKALAKLGLDILNQAALDQWYEKHIIDTPCSPVANEEWEEFVGYFRKGIYIKSDDEEELAVLKFAYYYPDGTTKHSDPVVEIEDD